jgi:hypothetical protein
MEGAFCQACSARSGSAAQRRAYMRWLVVLRFLHLAMPCTTRTYHHNCLASLQQEVVDKATRNMEQQPVDLLQGTVPEFRRVAVQGTYDHSRTAFVGPRPLRWVLYQQPERLRWLKFVYGDCTPNISSASQQGVKPSTQVALCPLSCAVVAGQACFVALKNASASAHGCDLQD